MKNYFFALIYISTLTVVFAQPKQLWNGYFSYNDIKSLSESPNKLYAASENAMFIKNNLSGEIKTYNTIDGLSGETITVIFHSENTQKTIFGYQTGLLVVRNELDGKVTNVVDILNKSIPENIKKVNHIMEYDGILYISCDFGIVQYDLATLQFGDTYLIGNNGSQIKVNQTAVFEGRIYAATQTSGIRHASITNPNLNDFNQWTVNDNFGWKGIQMLDDKLMVISTDGNFMRFQNGTLMQQTHFFASIFDFKSYQNNLVITTLSNVYVYNSNLSQIASININSIAETTPITFTCATAINNVVYIGTSQKGVFSAPLTSISTFENILPDGPYKNAIFNIHKTATDLWAVYGGFDYGYNPYGYVGGSLAQFGISKFNSQNGWSYKPYSEMLGAKALTKIIQNPNNSNQLFISSTYSGVLKIENDVATNLFNATNTGSNGLQTIPGEVPDDVRIYGSAFDKNGALWVSSSFVDKPLISLKPSGTWQAYSLQPRVNNYVQVVVDKNDTKWIASTQTGLYAFNETTNRTVNVKDVSSSGIVVTIRAIAIDTRNKLWIGTNKGIRVVNSVDEYLTSNEIESDAIIILEDGLAQELLFEQFILDIVVDGANNKWISTAESGVFKFSPDGQQQLLHFTTTNSPLPSNNVNDIEIDTVTGEVFFVTEKGMVSYRGTATGAGDNLENVYVYPNPVRPEFSGTVKISGLTDKAIVKITDITGNLVFETTAAGGTIEWDTTAFGKYKVASGVYMIFVSAEDGIDTKVKKVMIIR